MATAQDVIKYFIKKLDKTTLSGTAALDEAVKYVSSFTSWFDLRQTMANDCASYAGDYENFLRDKCGIILDNDDTGAISGSDAGGSYIKTASSVIPEYGYLYSLNSQSFTTNGLTVTFEKSLSSMNYYERYIADSMYTWWVGNALSLIKESYGLSYSDSGAFVRNITVIFENKGDNGTLAKVTNHSVNSWKSVNKQELKINTYYFGYGLDTSSKDGITSSTDSYLDRTIAHEFVHGLMYANVSYAGNLNGTVHDGLAELIHGIDDERRSSIIKLAKSSSKLVDALNNPDDDTRYEVGYMLFRYLAKQASTGSHVKQSSASATSTTTSTTPTTSTTTYTGPVTVEGSTMTINGRMIYDVFLGGWNPFSSKSAVTYYNTGVKDIDASGMTNAKFLGGNSNNNSIVSGSGGASLWGGSGGNDTLVGGSGRDTFFYRTGNGNDTVENFYTGRYATNSDILVITSKINRISRDEKEVVFTMKDGGKLTVMTDVSSVDLALNYSGNAKTYTGVKIGNTDSANKLTYDATGVKHYFGGYSTDTLSVTGSGSNNIKLSKSNFSSIEVIDASNSTGKNTLIGDSGNNTLKAGTGVNRLWGNSGYNNDTLIGNDGTDHFYYGKSQGNDVVENAGSGDYVRLYNVKKSDIKSVSSTGSGVKMNIGSGSLTVDNTAGVTFVVKGGAKFSYNSYTNSFSRKS